jgi:hypothetical protein
VQQLTSAMLRFPTWPYRRQILQPVHGECWGLSPSTIAGFCDELWWWRWKT